MNILAADTCTMAATAAVISDDRLVAQVVQNNKKTHSQNIMPMIDSMLKTADMTIADIDAFAVAAGPGSFTGVRIGVSTIKALAHTADKPCVTVSALKALAYNTVDFDGIICPIMDARRGQVYNALFKGGDFTEIEHDRAVSAEELCKELNDKTEGKVMFMGDGVNVFSELIKANLKDRAVFAKRSMRMSLAASTAELAYEMAVRGETCNYEELKPFYLRLSQAERERREKLKQEIKN